MQNFHYVYILIDTTTETHHYVGSTQDLQTRLTKHNAGEVRTHLNSSRGKLKQPLLFHQRKKPMRLKHILKLTAADHSPTDTFDL